MNAPGPEAGDPPDFSHLTDAQLVQRIADMQATVNALLAEISRRLGDQKPVDAAQ